MVIDRALLLLLLAAYLPAAQSGGPPQQAGTAPQGAVVEGKVVSSSDGKPVGKATVLLRAARLLGDAAGSERDSYTTQTDAAGHFVLAGVSPGTYECAAARSGFESHPVDRPEKAPRLIVAEGQHVEGPTLRLMPLGVISGLVLDPDGQPVSDADVFALQYAYSAGGKTLTARAKATSDDHGEFRMFGLYPGPYYVRAVPAGEGMFSRYSSFGPEGVNRIRLMDGANLVRGPAPQPLEPAYYPDAADPAQARSVEVTPRGEAQSTDIRLQRHAVYSISGKLPAAEGRGPILVEKGSGSSGRGGIMRFLPDGGFVATGLASGSYILTMYPLPDQDAPHYARAFVEVTDHDVEGVQLESAPAVEISGSVKTVAAGAAPVGRLPVRLQPKEGEGPFIPVALTNADGTFTIRGIVPDVYHVTLGAVPDGNGNPSKTPNAAYAVSIRLGDAELPDGMLDLRTAANGPLTLKVSTEMGSVDGKVIGDDGQPVPDASVALVPDQTKWDWHTRYREMEADSEGRFAFQKVVPGSYKLFSWKDAQRGAAQDADFRRPFERLGVPVNVEARRRQTLELKAIDAEKRQ